MPLSDLERDTLARGFQAAKKILDEVNVPLAPEDIADRYLFLNTAQFSLQMPPAHQWWLVITPEFRIGHVARPSAWRRFWHRVLLGWTWEPIEKR